MTAPGAAVARILLVGMMGSGKTTVGRLLAERTGYRYVDNDEVMVRLFGVTPREALAQGGESGLRALESDALAASLEEPAPVIVGVPAGTILDRSDRRRLADAPGRVVWLRAGAATLAERAVGAAHRPWLEEDALEWFAAALAEREHLYLTVADVVVDVDERTPAGVVDEIANELELDRARA